VSKISKNFKTLSEVVLSHPQNTPKKHSPKLLLNGPIGIEVKKTTSVYVKLLSKVVMLNLDVDYEYQNI